MIYEAKLLGASAVLLIVAILDEAQLKDHLLLCDRLGLSALVEIHNEQEAEIALRAGARILGVNNRNLKDFAWMPPTVSVCRRRIPRDIRLLSPKAVSAAVGMLPNWKDMEADAVLIGEALMRAPDKSAMLRELRGIS